MTQRKKTRRDDVDGDRQFREELFPRELDDIAGRGEPRARFSFFSFFLGLKPAKRLKAPSPYPPPSTENELSGLAFSGGGIRSATFNLGVLQALADHDVLRGFTYLSTVSGGGFIGASLRSALQSGECSTAHAQFPFRRYPGRPESDVLRHLRRSGSYLAPDGLLGFLRIPGLLLRGIVINSLAVLPWLLVALIAVRRRYDSVVGGALGPFPHDSFLELRCAAGFFVIASLCFALAKFIAARSGKIPSDWKDRDGVERLFAWSFAALIVTALWSSFPLLLWGYRKALATLFAGGVSDLKVFAGVLTGGLPILLSGRALGSSSGIKGKALLWVLGFAAPLLALVALVAIWSATVTRSFGGAQGTLFGIGNWWILVAAAVLFVIGFFIDVNDSSMHSFYRDKLSRAYLFKVDDQGRVEANDGIKLSELTGESERHAPYLLINTAVNLQDSESYRLSGRDCDSFVLSKLFVGSPSTGYCPTDVMEYLDRRFDLATSVAVSGAAVAPNMGGMTIRPLRALLALLNARLDRWIANPRYASRSPHGSFFSALGSLLFVKELLGDLDERGYFVNLSDGGHIENLGVYELLRRRCKYILASDAGQDGAMTFSDLARLIRMAEIDWGIKIKINLDDLRPDPAGLVKRPYAIGEIDYDGKETGYFIYLKASMPSGVSEDVRGYKAGHSEFPHESTADQFFDEAQFESYRSLGYQLAETLFRGPSAPFRRAGHPSSVLMKPVLDGTAAVSFAGKEDFATAVGLRAGVSRPGYAVLDDWFHNLLTTKRGLTSAHAQSSNGDAAGDVA